MSIAIQVDNLQKSFKDKALAGSLRNQLKLETLSRKRGKPKKVLSDINFEIRHGESVGLIGSNGSGKSTLLKCLSRIIWPTSGTITLNGTLSPMLEVGTGFYPDLSGRENIYLSGSLLGMSKLAISEVYDKIVAFAEIQDYIEVPVRYYSSGMYVRLGFAVSSLLASDIMIIDEVLAVGDNHFKKKCVKHLSSQFRDIGKTLLVVSHDMHLINSICDRCLVLDHGELIYDGTPESAIKLHLSMPSSGSNTALKTDYFIIQKVEVTSSDIQLTGKHRAGEKLEFKMSIEVLLKIPDVIFDIKVRHRSQGVISTINNLTSGTSIFLEKGQSKVICEIPTTPLNEGEYLLDLEVQHKHHLLASQKNVAKLHIEGGTFFESGRLPKPSQGLALIKSRWIHQDNA